MCRRFSGPPIKNQPLTVIFFSPYSFVCSVRSRVRLLDTIVNASAQRERYAHTRVAAPLNSHGTRHHRRYLRTRAAWASKLPRWVSSRDARTDAVGFLESCFCFVSHASPRRRKKTEKKPFPLIRDDTRDALTLLQRNARRRRLAS